MIQAWFGLTSPRRAAQQDAAGETGLMVVTDIEVIGEPAPEALELEQGRGERAREEDAPINPPLSFGGLKNLDHAHPYLVTGRGLTPETIETFGRG